MSAEADIYPNKNFGFRPKSRPVVAFGVKSKFFILFGGAGDPSLWEGSFCLRGYAAQRRAAPCKNNRAAIVPKLVARVPRAFIGGTYLILPPRLFWNLFWSQKRFAPGQMPFSRRRCRSPRPEAIPSHIIPKFSSFTQKYSSFIKNSPIVPVKPLCYNECT